MKINLTVALCLLVVVALVGRSDPAGATPDAVPRVQAAAAEATSAIYGSGLRPLLEETAKGEQTLNLYGPGNHMLAQIVVGQGGNGGETRYRLVDHLGSTRVMLDQTGNPLVGYDYTPYGGASGGGTAQYGYVGQQRNLDLDTYHFPARQYDPTTRRFTGLDPLRTDPSPYVYTSGNPVNLLDPSGGQSTYFIFVDYDGFPGTRTRVVLPHRTVVGEQSPVRRMAGVAIPYLRRLLAAGDGRSERRVVESGHRVASPIQDNAGRASVVGVEMSHPLNAAVGIHHGLSHDAIVRPKDVQGLLAAAGLLRQGLQVGSVEVGRGGFRNV